MERTQIYKDNPMLLSICIPTHDGRAWFLKETLQSITNQLTPAMIRHVEICVSDNASQDETMRMIADFKQGNPGLLTYHRNEIEIGALNFHKVIEIARGRWCWFLGSDDQLEVNSIDQVLEWLKQHPDITGLTVDKSNFDRNMLHPAFPDTASSLPSQPSITRVLQSPENIIEELAIVQTYMSTQIFRRDLWIWHVQSLGVEKFATYGYFPHTLIITQMILENPVWMWGGQKLVKNRTNNQCLGDMLGNQQYKYLLETLDSILRVRNSIPKTHTQLRTRLLRRYLNYWLSPGAVLFCKELLNHNQRSDWELLKGMIVLLKHFPRFWLRHFVFLLLPHQGAKAITQFGFKKIIRRLLRKPSS